MANFPTWVCPTFGCSYSTSYSRNVEKHLSEVHDWSDSEVAECLNNFWIAYKKGRSIICRKSSTDPCYPRALLSISRNSQNSVSFPRGGGFGG